MTTHVLNQQSGDGWIIYHSDCIDVMRGMPERSIGLTISSIPFASLFTYSASDRDFGNCSNHGQFFGQFEYLVRELRRVTKPGRIACIHLMNLPTSKVRDGVIGLTDFRGKTIRTFVEHGWIYHSEVVIWKDPVTAMQRSKAKGLLWKELRKDSTSSRMGIPDTIVMFRAPGDNQNLVEHTMEEFPVEQWQKWASPVWMDIDQSDTLQFRSAREHEDERHLCPLQLEPIRRCMRLYSNPSDVVFDPFGGIASTGVVAIELGRRSLTCELKQSYYEEAARNLRAVEVKARRQMMLPGGLP